MAKNCGRYGHPLALELGVVADQIWTAYTNKKQVTAREKKTREIGGEEIEKDPDTCVLGHCNW